MSIQVFPPDQQGVGAFDGGKFQEQRPISFPGEYASVDRLGPLFYWAWGTANEEAEIGMHPHKAFEIMTYVIKGEVEHQDTLGTKQTVTAGGVQIMQTGSGVHHAEAFRGNGTQGFQIWFEPHLSETVKQQPTYNQYNHEDFPSTDKDGVTIKTIIGEGAPVHIVTDVKMADLTLQPGSSYTYLLGEDRLLSFLVLQGTGTAGENHAFQYKDYVIVIPENEQAVNLQAGSDQPLRLVAIEVPAQVDYPLYRK
jgi:redox-sensitive bicupin YhaK (pirin superfamily)